MENTIRNIIETQLLSLDSQIDIYDIFLEYYDDSSLFDDNVVSKNNMFEFLDNENLAPINDDTITMIDSIFNIQYDKLEKKWYMK